MTQPFVAPMYENKNHGKYLLRAILAARVLAMQARVSAAGGAAALELPCVPVTSGRRGLSPEEIERLVNRAVRLGGLLGWLDTCLARSVIRCRLMREQGADARVLMGLNKSGGRLAGHSWVVWPGGPKHSPNPADYDDVRILPPPDRFPGWTPDTDL